MFDIIKGAMARLVALLRAWMSDIIKGAMAGLVASLVIWTLSTLEEWREENVLIEFIRLELKDFKKYSDNVNDALDFSARISISEEIIRGINYKHMRRRIKPVSDRLSPDKKLKLNQALDFDYKEWTIMLRQGDLISDNFVEGEWPMPMTKSAWDSVFKKLEGLEWLELNK